VHWARHVEASSTYRAAAELVCAPRGDLPLNLSPVLRSPTASETPTTLKITNGSKAPVFLHWITRDGLRRPYQQIAPGATYTQKTFKDHLWVIADMRGDALGIYRATGKERLVTVRAATPPAR
jgi:hypothetical protein